MKIAVITGASSGMGWECAIRLWEQFPGLDEIWAVGRRKERLVKLEEKVNIPVRKFVLDLSQEKEREILKAELEPLTHLVSGNTPSLVSLIKCSLP